MKQIIIASLIVALGVGLFSTGVLAATYGKQIIRGTLVGYTDKSDTEIYKWTDGAATCYIMYFGKSGAAIDCK